MKEKTKNKKRTKKGWGKWERDNSKRQRKTVRIFG